MAWMDTRRPSSACESSAAEREDEREVQLRLSSRSSSVTEAAVLGKSMSMINDFLSRETERSTSVADEALSAVTTLGSTRSTRATVGDSGIQPRRELMTLDATLEPLAQMGSSAGRGNGVGVGRVGLTIVAGAAPLLGCRQTRREAEEVEARRRRGREKDFGERGERARGVVLVGDARGDGGVEGAAEAMDAKEVIREGAPGEISAAQARMFCDFEQEISDVDVEGAS